MYSRYFLSLGAYVTPPVGLTPAQSITYKPSEDGRETINTVFRIENISDHIDLSILKQNTKMSCKVVTFFMLFVVCVLQKTYGSSSIPRHPQKMFCDSDYGK